MKTEIKFPLDNWRSFKVIKAEADAIALTPLRVICVLNANPVDGAHFSTPVFEMYRRHDGEIIVAMDNQAAPLPLSFFKAMFRKCSLYLQRYEVNMQTEILAPIISRLKAYEKDTFLWARTRGLLKIVHAKADIVQVNAEPFLPQDAKAREMIKYIEYQSGKRGVESL